MTIPLGGGILILPDMHIPYQDGAWITKGVSLALAWGIEQCLLAGDALNFDTFSRFIRAPDEERASFEEEIQGADAVFDALVRAFKRVWWLRGNHESRISVQSVGQIGMWTLQRLLGEPSKLQITEKQWALIEGPGATVRVTHPDTARKNPTSWAREMATIEHQHIILAHSHQAAFASDASGSFCCIDAGCCVDLRKLHYIWVKDKPRPKAQQGAVLLKASGGQVYPYLVTPGSDFKALARMYSK